MDNEFTWTQESGRQQTKPHVYDTDGTNLAAVLCAPDVDYTRTTSNDVVEILSVRDGLLWCCDFFPGTLAQLGLSMLVGVTDN